MLWCAEEFGEGIFRRDIILPTTGFLPASYAATPAQISALLNRVKILMSVDSTSIRLDLFDGSAEKKKAATSGRSRAVGHFHMEKGRAVISLDNSEAADPAYLTAIIAHELGHVRLLGERRISADRPDHERLTDLLTVCFGFGIFSANAALSYARAARGWSVLPVGDLDERTLNAARRLDGYHRLGYLSEREFGYALACYCRLRGETDPDWARHLDVGPRVYLTQGLAYLASTGAGRTLPAQRAAKRTVKQGGATISVVYGPAHGSSPFGLVIPPVNRRPKEDPG